MIIYRMTGQAEVWGGTGMLPIDPQVLTGLGAITKRAKAYIQLAEKNKIQAKVRVEKLTLGKADKETLMHCFREERPDPLIEHLEVLAEYQTATADK
jgi:hypothetical protein